MYLIQLHQPINLISNSYRTSGSDTTVGTADTHRGAAEK